MKTGLEEYNPKSLDEAVQILFDGLTDQERETIRATPVERVHHGFGTHMRNTWHLWEDNELTQDIKKRFGIFGHGDDVSAIILHMLWEKVIGNPPWFASDEHSVEALVKRLKKHWIRMGLDPATGKKLNGAEED